MTGDRDRQQISMVRRHLLKEFARIREVCLIVERRRRVPPLYIVQRNQQLRLAFCPCDFEFQRVWMITDRVSNVLDGDVRSSVIIIGHIPFGERRKALRCQEGVDPTGEAAAALGLVPELRGRRHLNNHQPSTPRRQGFRTLRAFRPGTAKLPQPM